MGPNGNSIFLPAGGNMQFDSLEDDNIDGWYWSSEEDDSIDSWAMALNVNIKGNRDYGDGQRMRSLRATGGKIISFYVEIPPFHTGCFQKFGSWK